MERRINSKYIKENFRFNLNKEKAIYSYLCGERLNKKQKKLLDDNIRFSRYMDWRKYQFDKYNKYNKEGLIEFEKTLNLYLRNTNQDKNIYQIFISSFVSVIFSRFISEYVQSSSESILSIIIWNMSIPVFVTALLLCAYKTFWDETKYIPFFEDMKKIITEIIEQK